MKYRTGLLPSHPDSIERQLATYLPRTALPTLPANFGHAAAISQWGMLGNGPDSNPADVPVGDCGICGPEHMIMAADAAAKRPIAPFTYASTIGMYTKAAGYDPGQTQPDGSNPTDVGVDLASIAKLWQSTGFVDAAGTAHKIVTYLGLNPRDLRQVAAATWLFEGVLFGFDLPESAEDQFDSGQPWTVTDAQIVGGHCVPVIGRTGGDFDGITWGGRVHITPDFIQEYATIAIVVLNAEMLSSAGISAEGFNKAQLLADLPALERV